MPFAFKMMTVMELIVKVKLLSDACCIYALKWLVYNKFNTSTHVDKHSN